MAAEYFDLTEIRGRIERMGPHARSDYDPKLILSLSELSTIVSELYSLRTEVECLRIDAEDWRIAWSHAVRFAARNYLTTMVDEDVAIERLDRAEASLKRYRDEVDKLARSRRKVQRKARALCIFNEPLTLYDSTFLCKPWDLEDGRRSRACGCCFRALPEDGVCRRVDCGGER